MAHPVDCILTCAHATVIDGVRIGQHRGKRDFKINCQQLIAAKKYQDIFQSASLTPLFIAS